jgi:serine/threonine protein kinase
VADDPSRPLGNTGGGSSATGTGSRGHPAAGIAAPTPPEWLPCPACQAANTADAHYCEQCGTELSNPAATTLVYDPRASRSGPAAAGRRGARRSVAADDPEADALLQLARREFADDYDVEREIGRGGMGVVYRAIELQLRRPVALKVLPPELALGESVVERFKREAQMAAALDHPNIIPIYRVGQSASLLYLAMKYVEGRPLDGVIASQGALPVPVVLLVLRAATSALSYAHEHGIVHRDVKGGNILIDRDGRVIVTDFGVARAIENASMTTTGSVIGTPYFMSPEQCAGKLARPQSDQYSLGVVAFQMLTGTVPFHADTLAAIMHHHFFTPVPDVSVARHDVPPELVAILNRVLAKDPDRRYSTTREMRIAVEAVPLSEADRLAGETMLRELAQGSSSVPAVRTDALPPLADTMSVVAAHDAFMRSADRVRKIRRHFGTVGILAGACVIALWGWFRPRHLPPASASPATTTSQLQSTAPTGSAAVPPVLGGPTGAASAAVATPLGDQSAPASANPGATPPITPAGATPHDSALPAAAASGGAASVPATVPDSLLPTGKLRVRVLPSTAEIMVDGRSAGQGAVFDLDVPSGPRRLHITAPGYADFDTTLVVVAGQTTQLSRITLKGVDQP